MRKKQKRMVVRVPEGVESITIEIEREPRKGKKKEERSAKRRLLG